MGRNMGVHQYGLRDDGSTAIHGCPLTGAIHQDASEDTWVSINFGMGGLAKVEYGHLNTADGPVEQAWVSMGRVMVFLFGESCVWLLLPGASGRI